MALPHTCQTEPAVDEDTNTSENDGPITLLVPQFTLRLAKSAAVAYGLASVNCASSMLPVAVTLVAFCVVAVVASVSGASATLNVVLLVLTLLPSASATDTPTL